MADANRRRQIPKTEMHVTATMNERDSLFDERGPQITMMVRATFLCVAWCVHPLILSLASLCYQWYHWPHPSS
jgi:hypothetical protein